MKKQIEQVKDFHAKTEQSWHTSPRLAEAKTMELRKNISVEEVREFEKACNEKDLVEVADAIIDSIFVQFGNLGAFGLADIAEELFDEVARSNSTKLCSSEEEARASVFWYANRPNGKNCIADFRLNEFGEYLIFRVSDNKTLKSINYSPADIKGIIRKALVAKHHA